ncbi:MAG: DUF2283 domain-containing protein [Acidimicrobiales bacterium]
MSTDNGRITIGGVTFDRVRYDRDADVLYLHVGDPSLAVAFDESPEGHHLRFDELGRLVGITIVGVGRDLKGGRTIVVTAPEPVEVDAEQLHGALGAA